MLKRQLSNVYYQCRLTGHFTSNGLLSLHQSACKHHSTQTALLHVGTIQVYTVYPWSVIISNHLINSIGNKLSLMLLWQPGTVCQVVITAGHDSVKRHLDIWRHIFFIRRFNVVLVNFIHFNYPRDAMLARVIAIATCLSVGPSVCHAPVLCENEES